MPTTPVDPIYTGQVGSINLNYDQTLAGIASDQTQLGQATGFDQAGNIDPSNPYSVAANLQRRYQQGQRGTTNSMAASGQLYSGAHQRNLDEGTYRYSRDYDSARRSALSGYQDLTERQQQATFNRDTGLAGADSDRLGRLSPADTVAPTGPAWTTSPEYAPQIKQAWLDYAKKLYNSGSKTGSQWRNIIDTLGYDPRGSF